MAEPDSLPALPTPSAATGLSGGSVENGHTGGGNNGSGASGKKARQAGVPVKKLLRALKAEGFFATPRGIEAIQTKLKEKGHTVTQGSLSTRLMELTQGDELYRQQSDAGFLYKDGPFQ